MIEQAESVLRDLGFRVCRVRHHGEDAPCARVEVGSNELPRARAPEMTEAIEFEQGTIDKFIGDGIMAIFGAPLDQPDHAERACAVAQEMVERLNELNDDRAARGLAPLAIGIGINTGYAVVGNIGGDPGSKH